MSISPGANVQSTNLLYPAAREDRESITFAPPSHILVKTRFEAALVKARPSREVAGF